MATSEAQSKSLIFQAQSIVADQLNKCEDLSATPFWPEDLLDIEFQIHDALSKQGIACTVMTPKLNYQGMCGKSTAWDFSNLQLVIVENPQINRARTNAMTALDIGYVAQEWLAGPSSETRGMFVPVSISQGEDGKLVVVTVELRGLLHDEIPEPVNTKFMLQNGTTEEYDIVGELDTAWLKANGFKNDRDVWLKQIAAFEAGTHLSSIGSNVFVEMHALSSASFENGVKSINASTIVDCYVLKDVVIGSNVQTIGRHNFEIVPALQSVLFKGRTLAQVQAMDKYPWGIEDTSVISAEL